MKIENKGRERMRKEKYIDDYIKDGDDVGALRYLAKEQYKAMNIGGTRKRLIERVADKLEKLERDNKRLLQKNNKLINKYGKGLDYDEFNAK